MSKGAYDYSGRSRACRNPECTNRVPGRTDLFCRACYYRLPENMRRKLWEPLYGGTSHIALCCEHLNPVDDR